MKIEKLIHLYLQSKDFERVGASSEHYKYWLRILKETELDGQSVWSHQCSLRPSDCQRVYDRLSDRGVTFANRILAVVRKVFSFGVKYDYVTENPWKAVQTIVTPPRRVVWTRDDVVSFLNVAYSDFETRSVGLIAHMAYDWAQRIGDMRLLTWDNLDLEQSILNLEQSKRRAVVHLPINDNLRDMLIQQQADLGWQPYVAPNTNVKKNGSYGTYTVFNISRKANQIKELAGLPPELRLSDLRRTATTEMVEAGVGLAQIMQVTGHQNPQSVKPYMKNTLTGATNALTLRSAHTAGETS
jgi:integrase